MSNAEKRQTCNVGYKDYAGTENAGWYNLREQCPTKARKRKNIPQEACWEKDGHDIR